VFQSHECTTDLTLFQKLSETTSSRLDSLRQWLGVAALRGLQVNGIPESYQVEALNS
jgi:hypothetical protein